MLHPRIGKFWAGDIGGFGEVSYSENFLHGCESAQWSMAPRTRHSALIPGARVILYEGTLPVWSGYLDQPGRDGTMAAHGGNMDGQGVLAVDGSGVPTSNPQVANAAAIARGAVPWTGTHGWAAAVGAADPTLTLSALFDRTTEAWAYFWGIDHTGAMLSQYAPTTPLWAVTWAEDLWSVSNDDYVTHLNVYYMSGAGTFVSYVYTTTEAAAAAVRWGRKEAVLDLTSYGIITLGTANDLADSTLKQTGPRMVLAESLTLQPGQLRTIGDQEAGWNGVHAGQMVRLWGVPDRSKVAMALHTDFVIGHLQRDQSTLTLTPQGAPPTNVREVIAAITAGTTA